MMRGERRRRGLGRRRRSEGWEMFSGKWGFYWFILKQRGALLLLLLVFLQ